MPVLTDESGCSGFKLGRGSTPHFVAVMVRFEEDDQAEAASAASLRERLGVKPEFKFSKCRDDFKNAFFACVDAYRFRIRALVVNKEVVYSANLRSSTDGFYNFFAQNMLRHDNGTLIGAKIKIDSNGGREFRRVLEVYLLRSAGPGKIRSVRFVDSRSDNLVQLADMCAGAIARSYKEGKGHEC